MKFLRRKDKVEIKVGDIKFSISPLLQSHMIEIGSLETKKSGKTLVDNAKKIELMVKYSLRSLEGIELYDGSKYELEFDEQGNLTDECASEVLSIPVTNEIVSAINSMLEGQIDKIKADEVEVKLGK